jgi:hypothetical protein
LAPVSFSSFKFLIALSIASAVSPEMFIPKACARSRKPLGRVMVVRSFSMHMAIKTNNHIFNVPSSLRLKSRYNTKSFHVNIRYFFPGPLLFPDNSNGEDFDRFYDAVFWATDYFKKNQENFDKGINIDTEFPFEWQPSKGQIKICFVKCARCNTIFICRSHHFEYCPGCIKVHQKDQQRIRRGAKQCKNCGVSLEKKYSNRKFCSGSCRTAYCRKRKKGLISPVSFLS